MTKIDSFLVKPLSWSRTTSQTLIVNLDIETVIVGFVGTDEQLITFICRIIKQRMHKVLHVEIPNEFYIVGTPSRYYYPRIERVNFKTTVFLRG